MLLSSTAWAGCSVRAPNLAFGAYDPLSGAAATTSASVVVTCDESPPPLVTLSLGRSAGSGGFFPRRMRQDNGSDSLAYNLYADPFGALVWGDGSGGTVTRSWRVLRSRPWTPPIFGRIAPGQDVAAGTYSDTLTVTVDF